MVSFKHLFNKQRLVFVPFILGGLFFICSSVFAANIGDKENFFVDPTYDYSGRTNISATLIRISENAYYYMEDDYWNSLSLKDRSAVSDYVNRIMENFDNYTYPSLRFVFGSEWKPGIDNDNRITILLTKLKTNAGGYFHSKDEISKEYEPKSNEREMLYVNTDQLSNPLIDSFIAHEFQHLISWNQKERINRVVEDVWLNEARSEYAPTVAGYDSVYVGTNLEKRVNDFLANPFDSLTDWQNERYDYPSVNLFAHYLAEQFGEDIFTKMITNNRAGIESIEQALRDKGYNLSFSQVFNNWTIANYLNNSSLSDGRYGYKNPYLRGAVNASPITYSIVSTSVINISQKVKNWAPYWYRFINKQDSGTIAKDLEIEFQAPIEKSNFNFIYLIEYKTKPVLIGMLNLQNQKGTLKIPNFKSDVSAVTLIISNQFQRSSFDSSASLSNFTVSVATTIFTEPVSGPQPNPEPGSPRLARPADYGLKEGDLIRAEGDFDVYIINQYGYKRLFLNPIIFNMYGHLGGWKAIKTVSPAVRDAFITSHLYRYSGSPKVYSLEVTGEDTGILHWINISAESFLAQGGKPEAIFTINKAELDWYPKGTDKTTL